METAATWPQKTCDPRRLQLLSCRARIEASRSKLLKCEHAATKQSRHKRFGGYGRSTHRTQSHVTVAT